MNSRLQRLWKAPIGYTASHRFQLRRRFGLNCPFSLRATATNCRKCFFHIYLLLIETTCHGTPIFMSRRVCRPSGQKGVFISPALPHPDGLIAGYYKRLLSDRLEAFPSNEEEIALCNRVLEYHHHRLCYEAESLFWNLSFWCMTAQPKTSFLSDSRISGLIELGFREKLTSND